MDNKPTAKDAVFKIAKFLLEEANKLPIGTEAEYRIPDISYNTIEIHKRKNDAYVRFYEAPDDSTVAQLYIYSTMSEQEITEKFYSRRFTDKFYHALACGWKLDGIKDQIMNEIQREAAEAATRNIRAVAEAEAIANFEV